MAITHALPTPTDSPEILPPQRLRDRTEAELVLLWRTQYPPATQDTYAAALRFFRAYLDARPLRDVTLADLTAYAASIAGLAPATRRTRLSALRSLFSFLKDAGHVDENPALLLRMPKLTDDQDAADFAERQVPERDDVRAMVAAEPSPRNRLLIRFAYLTGARNAEIRGLTIGALKARPDMADEDVGGQATLKGKGGKFRVVLIRLELWNDLVAWIESEGLRREDPVFPGRGRKPMNGATAWRVISAAAERVGLKAHVHDMRHAHLTDAEAGGASLRIVQQSAGHASPTTTAAYFHRRPREGSALFVEL